MRAMRFIPIDRRLDEALGAGREEFESQHRVSLGECATVVHEVVRQTLTLYATAPREAPWVGYMAVRGDDSTVVGTCGYKAGPDQRGAVEIAYFTFPPFEGHGYATEMARYLISVASDSPQVREIRAHTLPERNASVRVLEKVGMRWMGEVEDSEDGRVWRWVRSPGD
jgi:RimJ/RimL family protein N-acetyltransferase